MPITEQFKRSVAAVFDRKGIKEKPPGKRATSAVDVSMASLANGGYITKSSRDKPPEEMIPTAKGQKASRNKRGESDHTRKVAKFDRIWVLYLEQRAVDNSKGTRSTVV